MKKVFLITMFGTPFPWIQQYIDGVQHLEKDGWYWKIFTPNFDLKSKGNVEIVYMSAPEYADLVDKKLGIKPNLFVTDSGKPSVHITDFYIFSGVIFEDYIKDADFWGITNLDVVYGRLSNFVPDSILTCDIFSDDVNTINGVFSLWKNTKQVNNLFKLIPNWKDVLGQAPCVGCVSKGTHMLYGSDELIMTDVVRKLGNQINFCYPKYYPMLSHDRLEQHVPNPKLKKMEDGSLWEGFKDILEDTSYEHAWPMIGKEICYFHFSRTKRWPL